MKQVLLFSVFVLAYSAAASIMRQYVPPAERIQEQLKKQVRQRSTRIGLQTESIQDPGQPFSVKRALTARLNRYLTGKKAADDIASRLRRADVRLQVSEFVLCSAASALGFLAVSFAARTGMLIRVLAVMLGAWLPFALLNRKHSSRLKAFESQLPDCLTMMANGLRSGYSLHQAIDVVSREMPPPVSREFGQVMKESKLNVSLEDSLRNLVMRVPSADLDLMVTAILIQRQVGGNLADIFDSIQGTIRERIRILGEVRTLTAEGRISGWITGLLPFGLALMIMMLNPTYLAPMVQHPLGILMIAAGLGMQLIGALIIRKIINIEV